MIYTFLGKNLFILTNTFVKLMKRFYKTIASTFRVDIDLNFYIY